MIGKKDIAEKYSPKEIEDKWYAYWLEHDFFHSEPDEREAYSVVIPPPNVTGVLHMGHMLNNTIQDVLVRRARMQGKNACWVPGTDHASIATEAKVVAKLKDDGIDKKDLSREEFLKYAWEWKEKHGGIILEQLKKLGASCDWKRTQFTMDPTLSESVLDVFVDLYTKGLIYRGVRMVNWDPKAQTALSDEEVIYKEVQSKLYYLRYPIVGQEGKYIVVATTRPETILGDTAVCVHPQDTRYSYLKGQKVIVPLVGREVPIIMDEYVDMDFGTACLKVTPAHDINDYNLGIKHKLDSINIFNDDGTINDVVGMYVGQDRFVVRKTIVNDLAAANLLEKEEAYTNNIGCSERTDAVIEPKLSMQWFLRMQDTIAFYPAKFKNTYRHWMENVRDWCISRQLWWGHRIPAYYLPNREYVVAKSKEAALQIAKEKYPTENYQLQDLKQDEDVLDTWFSSWLWPMAVFDGIRHPQNKEIAYYYPTNDLVTAPEILFFWVARMIMAGLNYRKEVPFKNVYLTGIVRDKLGRKMSKSLGNSPDPIQLIEKYGADGVRVGMLLTSPAGNDLPFDESQCEQGRNFCNKIWNALRLLKTWTPTEFEQPQSSQVAIAWFDAKLAQAVQQIEEHYTAYRLSDALMTSYKLVWDDFCSWYLEMVKPPYQQPIDSQTYKATLGFFEKIMHLLHPFIPFITEEVWHILAERKEGESLMMQAQVEKSKYDEQLLIQFENVQAVIMAIRSIRNEKNIANKIPIQLYIKKNLNEKANILFDGIVSKLCNIDSLSYTDEKMAQSLTFVVKNTEFFVPLGQNVDVEVEIQKAKTEIAYLQGFLQSVLKKLSNDKFVSGAPAKVLENEKNKKQDAEQKIKVLEAQIKQWKI
ncbi:MAG: valine--tRNA ligase [Bacteroidales bacterium]